MAEETAKEPEKLGMRDPRITVLCVGTFLMDFTSHIASQATPAYAIGGSPGGRAAAGA